MTEREPRVFISYHRADVAVAEAVRACLVENNIASWMDQYDIPAGAYWPDEIDKGLGTSDFVVGLLSPDAVESRNVKNEWDWALQNGKQLLLLMVRTCVIPHRYVSINFIDATVADLQSALGALLGTLGMRPARARMQMPRTRYARSGGLNVAWQESGAGDIDIVWVPGFISHLELGWNNLRSADHIERFGSLGRLLRFDKRGTGMSDRALGIPSVEERMDDIRAVMDAAGSERAVLLGLSEGVPISVQFAATYPNRVRGLILYGGSATYVTRPDYPWQKTREEWERVIANEEATYPERWGTVELARESLQHYAPSLAGDHAEAESFAEFMRLSASPGAAIALDRMNLEVDVRGILQEVRVPTLVVNRIGELEADIGEARYLAMRIPGAILRGLPGNDHIPSVGDQEPYFTAIKQFLDTLKNDTTASSEPESVLATVVHVTA